MLANAIAVLYFIATFIFATNFFSLVNQIKNGSKKVNKLSLLAASTLIIHFACLGFFFLYEGSLIAVLLSLIYLVSCMIYIRHSIKKKTKK